MRTGLALLLIASVAGAPAAAQSPGRRFAAIVGGATLSDMSGFSATNDSRWGATAGLLVGMNTGRTALTFEGNYIQKGGGDTRLDYIELPLTFGGIVARGEASRFRFYSGVSVAFKVSCESDDVSCDSAEGTEWGLPIGLQFGRANASGTGFFGFDVRYTFALSDAFEAINVINRPWQFRVMIGKPLGE